VMKTLLPFQAEMVPILADRNLLLADDCGLGKTIQAIEATKRYSEGPVLIVCPRNVKAWWAQEIRNQDAGVPDVCEAAGRGLHWTEMRPGKPLHYVIVHPEVLRYAAGELLKAVPWDWIVVDEAHRFKNRKAAQTKALWKLKSRRKTAMTATPYGRHPGDMWALLRWLYPKKFRSYWGWYEKYVDSYQPRGKRYSIPRGPKNLRRMAKEISHVYRRRTKDEVGLDLPPMTYADVPVMIDGRTEELYRKLLVDMYAEIHGEEVIIENALTRVVRLHQAALDPSLLVDTGFMFPIGEVPPKVRWLEEWLDDHPNEPVILVSRYRKFVERWLQGLAPSATIVGGMSQRQVQAALAAFYDTGRLVGSLAAICEGLNLQMAATIIVTDGTWSPVQAYQLSQRIHRIGQTQPCQVIHLVGKLASGRQPWTVDRLVRRAITRRMSEAAMVDEFVKDILEGGDTSD